MAIYEYRCDKCKHEFEKIQKMSDKPLIKCPKCNKNSLKKIISKSTFKLKGKWFNNGGY